MNFLIPFLLSLAGIGVLLFLLAVAWKRTPAAPEPSIVLCASGHHFQKLTEEMGQCSRCGFTVAAPNAPDGLAEYLRSVQSAPQSNPNALPLHHYKPAVPVSGPNAEAVLCSLCGKLEPEGNHQIPKPEHAPGIPPEPIPSDHTVGCWYTYREERILHTRKRTFVDRVDMEEWKIITAAKWPSLEILEEITVNK